MRLLQHCLAHEYVPFKINYRIMKMNTHTTPSKRRYTIYPRVERVYLYYYNDSVGFYLLIFSPAEDYFLSLLRCTTYHWVWNWTCKILSAWRQLFFIVVFCSVFFSVFFKYRLLSQIDCVFSLLIIFGHEFWFFRVAAFNAR